MVKVWPLDLGSPVDKAVLLALADAANPVTGRTWLPLKSKADHKLDLVKKTGWAKRTVQTSLDRLEEAGHLTREHRPGKGVVYHVHPIDPALEQGGATDAPLAGGATAAGVRETARRGATAAPKTKVTQRVGDSAPATDMVDLMGDEPGERLTERDVVALGVPASLWADYAAHRKAMKKPLSPGAVNLAARQLRKWKAEGLDLVAIIEKSIDRGWVGLFPPNESDRKHERTDDNERPHNPMVAAAADEARAGGHR